MTFLDLEEVFHNVAWAEVYPTMMKKEKQILGRWDEI